MNRNMNLSRLKYLDSGQFFLIAGPCVVESKELCQEVATQLVKISHQYQVPFVFKASYRKANRSSATSFSGIGDVAALKILQEIGEQYDVPVVTDIHTEEEADMASHFVDILQIPAFLCRQTSLLIAAAKTQKLINIKKGQFMSPEAMKFAVDKVKKAGNERVWLTDRGTCFGYQDLVVDFRGIPTMQSLGVPVVMDCTHSLQQPNQMEGITGGRPDQIPTIARAAIAVGADGLFIETHPSPATAKSDGANMLSLDQMELLIGRLVKIRQAVLSL